MDGRPTVETDRLRAFGRAIRAVVRSYRGERIGQRAAALTYLSVFSLVPLLTVALMLLQWIHEQAFKARVHAFIQSVLAPGIRAQSASAMERFLSAASARAVGGIGFLLLAFTAGALIKELDESVNELWNVHAPRSWPVRIVLYAAALTLGPVLLALSLAGTAGIRNALLGLPVFLGGPLGTLISFAATVVGITLLYVLIPHAHVRISTALIAGVTATLGWEIAKHVYAFCATYIFHYSAIYGSLGAIPLFLLWIYVSWVLILFGLRLAYALQHASALERWTAFGAHPRGQELLALHVAATLTHLSREKRLPTSAGTLATRALVPEQALFPLLERFSKAGLITLTGERVALVGSPGALTLEDACRAVSGPEPTFDSDRRLLETLEQALDRTPGKSWEVLAAREAQLRKHAGSDEAKSPEPAHAASGTERKP